MTIEIGFRGQRFRALPAPRVAVALRMAGASHAVVTDAGFFPSARGHGKTRPHGSAQCIVIVCTQGAGACSIDGTRHDVVAGQALLIPPDVPHSYWADTADPWSIWWLHLTGRDMQGFLRTAGVSAARPVRHMRDTFQAQRLIGEVLSAMELGDTADSILLASGAAWHLLTIVTTQRLTGVPSASVIDRARASLIADPSRRVSVAELAATANLSPSHFATLFRDRVGTSVLRFQTEIRMGHARELLDTTSMTIARVAELSGYDDPLYFARQFKSLHDMTPTGYRSRER